MSGEHQIVHWRVYAKWYFVLVILMALTIGAAYVPLGSLNNAVAVTIAVVKATIVVLFFMQVRFSSRLTWLWAALGFIWLLLMFLTVTDYMTRDWMHIQGWPQSPPEKQF